jgi:hypothetical protein
LTQDPEKEGGANEAGDDAGWKVHRGKKGARKGIAKQQERGAAE